MTALHRREERARLDRCRGCSNRIQQLGTRKKNNAGAGKRQQPAHEPRIDFEIVAAALHGAKRDCIDDQPRFEARLDGEKPTYFPKQLLISESLRLQRANNGFEPFRT
jgi:hypothetical protein